MAGRVKGTPKTGGRRKGTPNKVTAELKEMITAALDEADGVKYFVRVADEHPAVFCALLGRMLPKDERNTVSMVDQYYERLQAANLRAQEHEASELHVIEGSKQ